MNSYQYIHAFWKAILLQSVQIQGRVVVLPQGHELNYDNFGQVLIEATKGVKYPLMAWRPVRSQGKFIVKNDEWESYQFEMFFVNTTYYSGANQTKSKNSGTGTSSKPIIQEWEEMKVAALDFIRVLQLVQKGNNGDSVIMLNNMFRLHTDRKKYIEPVSIVGTNRLSGVRLLFEADVFTTCAIQDYVEGGLIVLPPVDESTFEPELIVVRNEVINILEELSISSGSLNLVIDGAGSVITTGLKSFIEWGFDAEITGWTILGDIQGDIVVDVWKDEYGNFAPTIDDTIAGTEKPTLAAAQKNQNLNLTSFNKTVSQGDIWAFNVDSASDVKRVTLAFRFNKV